MESERDIEARAQQDSRVVWPLIGDTLQSAKVMIFTVLAVVAGIGLLDLIVARGALGLFD
jgi:hypothetical protein